MYMTGQISPYYLKDVQNNVFLHLLKVSGTAALSGEAISGFHSGGKYYLTNNRDEVAYYKKRARQLLDNALPLMDIYRAENAEKFNAFLLADSQTEGKRRSILSAPPIYTLKKTSVCAFRNLQIIIHENKWAMVSKGKSPAIHFVIHHPKLRGAIESFVPPIIDK